MLYLIVLKFFNKQKHSETEITRKNCKCFRNQQFFAGVQGECIYLFRESGPDILTVIIHDCHFVNKKKIDVLPDPSSLRT